MNQKDQQLIADLDKLIQHFSDPMYAEDLDTLKGMYDATKQAIFFQSLYEDVYGKELISFFVRELKDIEFVLLHSASDKVSSTQRDALIKYKDFLKTFIRFFTGNTVTLDDMRNRVEEELKVVEKK